MVNYDFSNINKFKEINIYNYNIFYKNVYTIYCVKVTNLLLSLMLLIF
jgi:hypothetical protein